MRIINIFTICLAVIFESFFGVFVSNAMKFSPENIKSLPSYASAPPLVQQDLDRICDRLKNKNITNETKALLLTEMACYTNFSDEYITQSIIAIVSEEAKKKADRYDQKYDELEQGIKSKEKMLNNFKEELDKIKGSHSVRGDIDEFPELIENIDECLKLIENVKTKMKEYDTTKQDIPVFTKGILRKKYQIIENIEKIITPVWSKYNTILIEMSDLNAEYDSNSSDGDSSNYLKNVLGGLNDKIETLKNYVSSKINDTSHTTKE